MFGSPSGPSCWGLVPIDHGLSIPDTLAINSYEVAWLSFEQASKPFSQRTLDYINQIDIIEDLKLLEARLPFRPICLRNMRISGTLLKIGASLSLTLAQIGLLLCRPDEDDEQQSVLEDMVEQAEQTMKTRQRKSSCHTN
jgi:Phosphatidylinositol 3- and 4-kinase